MRYDHPSCACVLLVAITGGVCSVAQAVEQKTCAQLKLEAAQREFQEWLNNAPRDYTKWRDKGTHDGRIAEAQQLRLWIRITAIRNEVQLLEGALKEGDAGVNAALKFMIEGNRKDIPEALNLAGGTFVDQSLVELMIQEQDLAQRYGPDHPKVKNIRQVIELIHKEAAANRQQVILSPKQFLTLHLDSLRQELRGLEIQDRELFKQEMASANLMYCYAIAETTLLDNIARLERVVARELKMQNQQPGPRAPRRRCIFQTSRPRTGCFINWLRR